MTSAKPMIFSLNEKRKEKRSKEYIQKRLDHEEKMKIGDQVFTITENILCYPVAVTKWEELVKIFKQFDFVSNVDIGAIEKYCIAHAEYYQLLELKKEIEKKSNNIMQTYYTIDKLKLDHTINKKVELLVKLEDRLFLNPLSRLKNIPKFKEDEKPDTFLQDRGFGNL